MRDYDPNDLKVLMVLKDFKAVKQKSRRSEQLRSERKHKTHNYLKPSSVCLTEDIFTRIGANNIPLQACR